MELIDRYLQAVKFALPASQRDDIVRELSDSILSQVEEREAGLGRPLTEDELVELLRKMGKPAVLASRYREQQGLIGATVLPVYWKVLKAALGVAFLVQVIASVVTAAAGRPLLTSLAPIFSYPSLALKVFAWVTLAFAALRFFGPKLQVRQEWDPRKLPPLVRGERKKGRTEAIGALIMSAIGGVWWLVALREPFWIFGPGVFFMTFAPVWMRLYPLFVLLAGAEVLRHVLEVAKPYATKLHAILAMAIRGLSLVVLFFLVRAKDVFVASDTTNAKLQPVLGSINYALHIALIVAATLAAAKLLLDIWKLAAGRPEPVHQAAVGS